MATIKCASKYKCSKATSRPTRTCWNQNSYPRSRSSIRSFASWPIHTIHWPSTHFCTTSPYLIQRIQKQTQSGGRWRKWWSGRLAEAAPKGDRGCGSQRPRKIWRRTSGVVMIAKLLRPPRQSLQTCLPLSPNTNGDPAPSRERKKV